MKFKHEQKKMQASYWVAGIVVGCVTIAGFVYLANVIQEREYAERAIDDVNQQIRQNTIALLEQADEGGVDIRDAAKTLGQNVTAFEQAAEGYKGSEAAAMEVLVGILREFQGHGEKYAQSVQTFEDLGELSAAELNDRQSIASRLQVIDEMHQMNEGFDAFLGTVEQRMRAKLIAADLTTEASNHYTAIFMANSQMEIIRQVRETDRRLIAAEREMMMILDERWGTWQYDAATESISFETDEDVARFNRAVANLDQAADEQLRLQQKALEFMKQEVETGQ